MIFGGSLYNDAIYKKILSIGYEFETHDIAKLSLHDNKKWLINSDTTPRSLKFRKERGTIEDYDLPKNNYIKVRIPIHEKGKIKEEIYANYQSGKEEAVDEAKSDEEEEEEEEEDEEELARIAAAQLEETEKEEEGEKAIEADKLKLWENEEYLEYYREPREKDWRKDETGKDIKIVEFNITTDLGEIGLDEMMKEQCEGLPIHKNDLYLFIENTEQRNEYELKFNEDITNECDSISGVEYIITYYDPQNPREKNSNVIIETYIDACSRILDHLSDLHAVKGQLVAHVRDSYEEFGPYEPIGQLDKGLMRKLYNKLGTNLYYMDTYDDIDTQYPKKFEDFEFIPQMTFRCKTEDAIPIMKHMLDLEQKELIKTVPNRRIEFDKKLERLLREHRRGIQKVEGIVDSLIAIYNDKNENKITTDAITGQRFKTYVFFIFYKLYYLNVNHLKILSGEDYLKDSFSFSSRHGNYDFYLLIKQMFKENYGVTDISVIHDFFYNKETLRPLYQDITSYGIEDPNESTDREPLFKKGTLGDILGFNKEGAFDNAFTTTTKIEDKNDPNYGNPMFSISSYFKHFEDPKDDTEFKPDPDWLAAKNIDIFSTKFDLKDDAIMLENRVFRYETEYIFNQLFDTPYNDGIITIGGMRDIVKKVDRLYDLKLKEKTMFAENIYQPQFINKKNRFTRKGGRRGTQKRSKKLHTTRKRNINNKRKSKKR